MTTDNITISRSVVEQIKIALQIGQDAFSQAFGGYGFYRPENPHNFFPDPECCTEKEISNHSAACEAYDKGTYIPDHKDGWITPDVHVTSAPWGIGTYTDECKEITDAITNLTAALEAAKNAEPVACKVGTTRIGDKWYLTQGGYLMEEIPAPQPSVTEGWQPIETAPKSADRILLLSNGEVETGKWQPLRQAWVVNGCYREPTHWMPLPAAPKGGE